MHTINITDDDYKKAAIRWRKELLLLPLFSCMDTLKYMTGRPGIRYQEKVGSASSNAQFAPYKADRKSANTTKIEYRTLETFFGNVVEDFEPNQLISTLLGASASFLGDGQKSAPDAKMVLSLVAKALGNNLHDVIFTATRNASGDTTADLFNGFSTIAAKEITDGNISAAKGNLLDIKTAVTSANAVDIAKQILYAMDPHLRQGDNFLFCDQHFADMYNEGYLLSHAGISYNKEYNQPFVEGSGNRLTIVPLASLEGTKKFYVTPKANMLYGYDSMSDVERIQVDRFAPFILTFSAAMFFGTQFESIDKRRLLVVDMATE